MWKILVLCGNFLGGLDVHAVLLLEPAVVASAPGFQL
jgi:hypothetical protein